MIGHWSHEQLAHPPPRPPPAGTCRHIQPCLCQCFLNAPFSTFPSFPPHCFWRIQMRGKGVFKIAHKGATALALMGQNGEDKRHNCKLIWSQSNFIQVESQWSWLPVTLSAWWHWTQKTQGDGRERGSQTEGGYVDGFRGMVRGKGGT